MDAFDIPAAVVTPRPASQRLEHLLRPSRSPVGPLEQHPEVVLFETKGLNEPAHVDVTDPARTAPLDRQLFPGQDLSDALVGQDVPRQERHTVGNFPRAPVRMGGCDLDGENLDSVWKLTFKPASEILGPHPLTQSYVRHLVETRNAHRQGDWKADPQARVEPLTHRNWQLSAPQRPLEQPHHIVMRCESYVSPLAKPYSDVLLDF